MSRCLGFFLFHNVLRLKTAFNMKKRCVSSPDDNLPKRPRQVCSYGERCYRRNPAHFRECSHPHLESILDNYTGTGEYPIPKHLHMERFQISEQLQIMVEKNIHSCGNMNKHKILSTSRCTDEDTDKTDGTASSREANVVPNDVTTVDLTESTSPHNNSTRFTQKCAGPSVEHVSVAETISVKETAPVDATSTKLSYSDYRPVVQPTRKIEDHFSVVLPKGCMAKKHQKAAPYYIFYTTIAASKETHTQDNSITFQEILDPSLGELKYSLQINFMVDMGWLVAQYYFAGYSLKPLTVLYGEDIPDIKKIMEIRKNVDAHQVNTGSPFGKHHTKMMLLCYEDGSLRVVVSTANLVIDDWENRTQGLWFSPSCPELPASAMPHHGESPTGFKQSLLAYLDHYRSPYLTRYIERVRRCDFSAINVFLVASVPGGHSDAAWGMARIGAILSRHCELPQREPWPLVAQASSIGSYGSGPELWLTADFQKNFYKVQNERILESSASPKMKIIYPSLENVLQSHDGILGGGCLPYSGKIQAKQQWLNTFLHQWKAVSTGRDKAMPHIKTYLRVSPDYKQAAYYLLTSANISKAAWGSVNKGNRALRIMSYEAGVLFLPRFVINKQFFSLEKRDPDRLRLAYDLPPVEYTPSMTPWVQDHLLG